MTPDATAAPTRPHVEAPATEVSHLIDGVAVATDGDGRIDVLDPRDGSLVGRIPLGTDQDTERAVRSASAAAPGWARTDPAERGDRLRRAAGVLRAHSRELADLQSREGGKPLDDSLGGVEAGIAALEQYAQIGPLHRGRSLQGSWHATDLMVHEPLGVVAAITPWNDPVAILGGVVGAALVAGNTVVLKPSERTPLCGLMLAELLARELPPGVLDVLLGDGRSGRSLVAHPDVDAVVHIGSVATGRDIARMCADQLKPAVLELGGKDALVVDADVDPAWAAREVATGAFANAGQICTSVERVYVHEAVATDLVDELVALAGTTTIGPLIDDAQRQVVDRHVTEAVAAGATLRCGGEVPAGSGSWYPPTVLTGVPDNSALMVEETFGPVAAVRTVGSFDEALELAGRSRYGLAATVLTASQDHAQRAWRELRVGTVKVNAVFGGAPGGSAQPGPGSGLGFGYGPELLDQLTHTKVVHLAAAPAPRRAR